MQHACLVHPRLRKAMHTILCVQAAIISCRAYHVKHGVSYVSSACNNACHVTSYRCVAFCLSIFVSQALHYGGQQINMNNEVVICNKMEGIDGEAITTTNSLDFVYSYSLPQSLQQYASLVNRSHRLPQRVHQIFSRAQVCHIAAWW